MSKKIAIIVWSLRKDSYNRKVAQELIKLAPTELEMSVVEIADIPLYNEDLETEMPPASWTAFREALSQVDGVIFLTPEYNRTTSAVLKNAIDVWSRPRWKSIWWGKAGAVISVSVSPYGWFGANHSVRQSMVVLDMPMMQQPELYLANINKYFDENGNLAATTKEMLQNFVTAYTQRVQKIRG